MTNLDETTTYAVTCRAHVQLTQSYRSYDGGMRWGECLVDESVTAQAQHPEEDVVVWEFMTEYPDEAERMLDTDRAVVSYRKVSGPETDGGSDGDESSWDEAEFQRSMTETETLAAADAVAWEDAQIAEQDAIDREQMRLEAELDAQVEADEREADY